MVRAFLGMIAIGIIVTLPSISFGQVQPLIIDLAAAALRGLVAGMAESAGTISMIT